jgi:hypothetical protein
MHLVINVIGDRTNDRECKTKIDEAASADGMKSSKIKINNNHYLDKIRVV